MKLLSALRWPLTLKQASRLVTLPSSRTDLRTPGRKQGEIGVGASVERQVDDGGVSDHVTAAAGIGFDGGRGADHFHAIR